MLRNQQTRKMFFESNFMSDELYHHGVMGQSWGERNGPPYPLGGVDKAVAKAEYKAKKAAEKKEREMERRMKKLRRAAKKKRKEDKRLMTREEHMLRKKQKLLEEGDLKKIRKHSDLFTNEELQWATQRHDLIEETKSHKKQKRRKVYDENRMQNVERFMNHVGTIAVNATRVADAAITAKKFVDSFKMAEISRQEAIAKRDKSVAEAENIREMGVVSRANAAIKGANEAGDSDLAKRIARTQFATKYATGGSSETPSNRSSGTHDSASTSQHTSFPSNGRNQGVARNYLSRTGIETRIGRTGTYGNSANQNGVSRRDATYDSNNARLGPLRGRSIRRSSDNARSVGNNQAQERAISAFSNLVEEVARGRMSNAQFQSRAQSLVNQGGYGSLASLVTAAENANRASSRNVSRNATGPSSVVSTKYKTNSRNSVWSGSNPDGARAILSRSVVEQYMSDPVAARTAANVYNSTSAQRTQWERGAQAAADILKSMYR